MKKLAFILVLLLASPAFAGEYRNSVKTPGICLNEQWQTVREWECPDDGVYHISYKAPVINNERYNVLVAVRLMLDYDCLDYTGYNISKDAHYGVFVLSWVGFLYAGEVIYIEGRTDSSRGIRSRSVVMPDAPDWHSALTVIEVSGSWYRNEE